MVKLKTIVFELSTEKYSNLSELAKAMGISVPQVYRVRRGKRSINEKFITGAVKAFPGYKLDSLFYVAQSEGRLRNNLGKILRKRRLMIPLTLKQLSIAAGVSLPHLSRIELGERFPSASILHKIAGPLQFSDNELFTLAGYLNPQPSAEAEKTGGGQPDPYVAELLSQEPVEVQRNVIRILSIFRSMANLESK